MLPKSPQLYAGLIALALSGIAPLTCADVIFTSPPREQNNDQSGEIYAPIAAYFTKLLGRKVVYHNPGNWLTYQKEMRAGLYDIVFDGPHFNSWRAAHVDHEVLVRLPGSVEYLVVADSSKDLSKAEDLVGSNVCSMAPPNLGTLLMLDKYRNPVRQPVVKAINGETGEVYQAFKSGKCKAAVLRTTFFEKKLTAEERKTLRVVFRSAALPNQGISVSNRLSPDEKNLIRKDVIEGEGAKVVDMLLKRYGQKTDKTFVVTSNEEYAGANLLLEGVIFGW